MFFGGDGFQLWKLHTREDYLVFLAYLAAGIFIFVLVVKYMNRQRNHEAASVRAIRKLKRLAGRPQQLYRDVKFYFPDGEQAFDAVLADKSGIYLIKVFGWGIKIYGSPNGETWRREDARRKEEFPNPLIELKSGAERLSRMLKENGIDGVKIMPLVVFADNYQTPELYIGYGSCSTTIQELKLWYKKQAVKAPQYPFEQTVSILNGLCVSPDGNKEG